MIGDATGTPAPPSPTPPSAASTTAPAASPAVTAGEGWRTNDAPYLQPVARGVSVTPLLTVGEEVPRTGNPQERFRLIGIPDGIGAYDAGDGTIVLFLNHELPKKTRSTPIANAQQTGAFVSLYTISKSGLRVLSGDLAYDKVYVGADAAQVEGAFGRFCSGYLAGPHIGFDRHIYFAGEEAAGEETFDGKGGQAVAIFDGAAYVLPDLGRYDKENIVAVPGTGRNTVLFGLEDGPDGLESQLYMYVGVKDPQASHPLAKNGLVRGKLYVFKSSTSGKDDEASLTKADGAIQGAWAEIEDAGALSDDNLNEASKGAGSFNFVRIEDGTYDRNTPGTFYFVTTGGDEENRRGRLYALTFDPTRPATGPATLKVLLDGDRGDPIMNPDNIDANGAGQLILLENVKSRNRSSLGGRDDSVWLYDLKSGAQTRVAEVHRAAVSSEAQDTSEDWEPSGIIDMTDILGPSTWLLDVQARGIDGNSASSLQGLSEDTDLVEGGQLLVLRTGRS